MYISRIDGDIVTYDVRMVKTQWRVYLSNPSMHTIEHLLPLMHATQNMLTMWFM